MQQTSVMSSCESLILLVCGLVPQRDILFFAALDPGQKTAHQEAQAVETVEFPVCDEWFPGHSSMEHSEIIVQAHQCCDQPLDYS